MIPLRDRISAAAHEEIPHANPLSAAQMEGLVLQALRHKPATALDIGCGPGAFSVGLAARAPIDVVAIDVNPAFLERGRRTAKDTALVGSIAFLERSLQEDEGRQFDLVVCVGSSGAVGSPREALRRCKELMNPLGVLVFADLVWNAEPAEEYLAMLGGQRDLYWFASEGQSVLAACGLLVEHECAASHSSWESYERAVLSGRIRFAASLPLEEGESLRTRALAWFANYERHGRRSLGFNAYVARHAEA